MCENMFVFLMMKSECARVNSLKVLLVLWEKLFISGTGKSEVLMNQVFLMVQNILQNKETSLEELGTALKLVDRHCLCEKNHQTEIIFNKTRKDLIDNALFMYKGRTEIPVSLQLRLDRALFVLIDTSVSLHNEIGVIFGREDVWGILMNRWMTWKAGPGNMERLSFLYIVFEMVPEEGKEVAEEYIVRFLEDLVKMEEYEEEKKELVVSMVWVIVSGIESRYRELGKRNSEKMEELLGVLVRQPKFHNELASDLIEAMLNTN